MLQRVRFEVAQIRQSVVLVELCNVVCRRDRMSFEVASQRDTVVRLDLRSSEV